MQWYVDILDVANESDARRLAALLKDGTIRTKRRPGDRPDHYGVTGTLISVHALPCLDAAIRRCEGKVFGVQVTTLYGE